MILKDEKYKITIQVDETYTLESADNSYYDLELNPMNYSYNDLYKTFSIMVENAEDVTKIALVGDYYSYDTDCAVLDGDILVVLQNDTVSRFDIKNMCLLGQKKFDCLGCNFGIYRINEGYIIYGEIEIVMLDNEFNKKWSFFGKDIFVSQSHSKSFELCNDRIKLYDWEDNYYEIDYSGKII